MERTVLPSWRSLVRVSLWGRLPVIIRAIIAGLIVLYAGGVPWGGIAGHSFFAGWNLKVFPTVPWAIAPMCVYLLFYWRYLNGSGWPRSSAVARRLSLRANGLSG